MSLRPLIRYALRLVMLGTLGLVRPAAAGVETLYDNDTNGMVPGPATTDRDYTTGLRVVWNAEPGVLPGWTERAARVLGGPRGAVTHRLSVSAGQELYTPDALSDPRPILDDRPYAAWLYVGAALSNADEFRARSLEVRAGVVGPDARGQQLQAWWHQREHVRAPRGWGHQLGNEPGLRVTLDERWRPYGRRRHADLVPHVRLTAGNILTEAAAGATLRLGLPLPDDFGPGAPSGSETGVRGFRLYGFTRAEGRAVARDLFLDGSTFRSSIRVHRIPLVAEVQAGFGVRYRALGFRYAYSYTTRQFRERPTAQEYGSVGISF